MEYISYNYGRISTERRYRMGRIDKELEETRKKSGLGPGPWQREPDNLSWVDEETGYQCIIERSPVHGAFCGFVGVPKIHEFHGRTMDFLYDMACKGIIIKANGVPISICDYIHDYEKDGRFEKFKGMWFYSFSCATQNDYSPRFKLLENIGFPKRENPISDYKDIDYVKKEVKSLCDKLKKVEKLDIVSARSYL